MEHYYLTTLKKLNVKSDLCHLLAMLDAEKKTINLRRKTLKKEPSKMLTAQLVEITNALIELDAIRVTITNKLSRIKEQSAEANRINNRSQSTDYFIRAAVQILDKKTIRKIVKCADDMRLETKRHVQTE